MSEASVVAIVAGIIYAARSAQRLDDYSDPLPPTPESAVAEAIAIYKRIRDGHPELFAVGTNV